MLQLDRQTARFACSFSAGRTVPSGVTRNHTHGSIAQDRRVDLACAGNL